MPLTTRQRAQDRWWTNLPPELAPVPRAISSHNLPPETANAVRVYNAIRDWRRFVTDWTLTPESGGVKDTYTANPRPYSSNTPAAMQYNDAKYVEVSAFGVMVAALELMNRDDTSKSSGLIKEVERYLRYDMHSGNIPRGIYTSEPTYPLVLSVYHDQVRRSIDDSGFRTQLLDQLELLKLKCDVINAFARSPTLCDESTLQAFASGVMASTSLANVRIYLGARVQSTNTFFGRFRNYRTLRAALSAALQCLPPSPAADNPPPPPDAEYELQPLPRTWWLP